MKPRLSQLLVGSLLAALVASGCSRAESPPPQAFEGTELRSAGTNEAEEAEAVIAVEGMVCQGCANAAAEAASQVPGCISARGVLEDGTVVVRYRPGGTTPEAIAAAIASADRGDAPAFTARVATR